ncbi:hydroxypyruvate isomerase [Agaricicola taiwanensis]|uniref:Hydroxypyruvate isomerase n=1 Tax=Agaricicola taiwanensis TaxID=591372 RepID=A0A8J2YLE0_9RHOB|nr:TIM barrel protein [Agaricicola taiwanensis]GGE50531.1 hydroxypyruvate isomerase [Agaricicola taiwanensis]
MSNQLSAHIGYLFSELPLSQRPAAARRSGFTAIEHPAPFAIPAGDMARILRDEGLSFAQIAAAGGDASKGEKGLTALPGREQDFRDSFQRSLDYAEAIGCPLIHPMAGVAAKNADAAAVEDAYRTNLTFAVEACRGRAVSVLVEAISEAAVPGYYMSTLDRVLAAADAVGPDDISILIDTFHARANGADAVAFVERHAGRIGHVHIADHPGRHEPGTGAFDFDAFLTALEAAGYGGAIGFEYIPAAGTEQGLGWLASWVQRFGADAAAQSSGDR